MSDEKQTEKTDNKMNVEDNISVTHHSITINGQTLNYTATAGTMILREEDSKKGHDPKAELFFVAYTVENKKGMAPRPLTFSFNGGPGSSSVWLHLGVLGPRRVPVSNDESAVPPPYNLQDNQFTLLTESDLVFIDPVGTGYSRMIAGEKTNAHEFHTYKRDIESVGEFIRLYTSRYQRWSAPKFLIGESYGTTRAAGLASYLQDRHGMFFNGIMLVSSILNFQTARFATGNDLPYPLFLPTYAATSWFHDQLEATYQEKTLENFLAEVEEFAETEYAQALMLGNKLPEMQRAHIVERLSSYTGLSWRYIEGCNMRINIDRFVKEILRDEGFTIGRFDSRILGRDSDDVGENHQYDPSFAVIHGVYGACLNDYVHTELDYKSDLPYEILNFNVFPNWKYNSFQNEFVNTAEQLRQAMTRNPHLKVLVANGYFDLATPYFATEYTFNHLNLRSGLEENITMTYYEAGHMMYIHRPSLEQLGADLIDFVRNSL